MWNLKLFSNRSAFINKNEVFTYNDIYKFSKKIKNKIKTKKLILILTENSIGCLLGYTGFFINKHTIMPINKNISRKALNNIIKNYIPDFIWTSNKNLLFRSNFTKVLKFKNYLLLKNNKKSKLKIRKNISLLVSTSGSTGSPKFIKQTFKNISENTKSILKYLPIKKQDVTITNLPLNYTYGISIINTHLKVGSSIVLTKYSILQKQFWRLFDFYKVTVINGVPYTYEILNKLKFFQKKNKSLKIITQAGGKLSNKLQIVINKYCSKFKTKFFIMYGQAEATTRISYLEYKKDDIKLGSVGKSIEKGKIFLKDNNEKIIKNINKTGSIYYSGPNVCEGYSSNRNDLSKKDLWKGIINTGDIGKKDSDGYLYIVGRSKRFAKIYGHSISLDDIEEKIKNKFNIYDVAVTGNNHNIFIIYSNNLKKNLVLSFLNSQTNLSKKIFLFRNLKKIPKLISGKVAYSKLEKL